VSGRTRRARPRPVRGTSLLELIAVIGIVGLLASLALPALSGVRAPARSSHSASNLRQMMLAAEGYAAIFGAMPVAVRYEPGRGIDAGTIVEVAWDFVRPMATPDAPRLPEPGVLWSFAGDAGEVMRCPTYAGPPDETVPHSGYNYNTSYVGGEGSFPLTGWDAVRPGIAPARWRSAATTAIFGAGGRIGGQANRFMRAPSGVEGLGAFTTYSGGQAFRFAGGRTPAAMGDGHVAWFGDPRPGANPDAAALEQFLGWPDHGFLSDDDAAYDPR